MGGGVLLDTARCGRQLLVWVSDVGIWWPLHDMEASPMSEPMLKSCGPKEDNAPG